MCYYTFYTYSFIVATGSWFGEGTGLSPKFIKFLDDKLTVGDFEDDGGRILPNAMFGEAFLTFN